MTKMKTLTTQTVPSQPTQLKKWLLHATHVYVQFITSQRKIIKIYPYILQLKFEGRRIESASEWQESQKPITGDPSSSCEMIILRNEGRGEIITICVGIFTTALRNKKNSVQFSLKIPHLTSTMPRLLSDRLLCWKEPILASYPFLGVLHAGKAGCFRGEAAFSTPGLQSLLCILPSVCILSSVCISPPAFCGHNRS